MTPKIDGTTFGNITIAGEVYDHDVIIRLNGDVEKRKKKLSKKESGSSHIVSKAEAKHIYEEGAREVIIGCGQNGALELSREAHNYFHKHHCAVTIQATPDAVAAWNHATGAVVAMFHVTC